MSRRQRVVDYWSARPELDWALALVLLIYGLLGSLNYVAHPLIDADVHVRRDLYRVLTTVGGTTFGFVIASLAFVFSASGPRSEEALAKMGAKLVRVWGAALFAVLIMLGVVLLALLFDIPRPLVVPEARWRTAGASVAVSSVTSLAAARTVRLTLVFLALVQVRAQDKSYREPNLFGSGQDRVA